jgi:hypothetical protein
VRSIPLILVLLVACGGDEAPAEAPEPTARAETSETPGPSYPNDEDLGGLLPVEPKAATDALEAAAAAKEAAELRARKAKEAAEAPPVDATKLAPIEVEHAVLAESVSNRQPVREGAVFREGSEVYCFNRLGNPSDVRRRIRHQWFHEGKRKSSIALSVKGKTWRTWSSLPVYGPGAWRVDIVDEADRVLTSLPFTVNP